MTIYLCGLLLLALGISFSVNADLGVSPVASLGYSLSLITNLSLGVATFLTNILFIIIQIIVSKNFQIKRYFIQLLAALFVSTFLDLTKILLSFLPQANTLYIQSLYLILSLIFIAFAVFFYLISGLPMMPYDTLIPTISNQYNKVLSKTKVFCDVTTVIVSLILCLTFLRSLGSIGIGTLITALVVGRILGIIMNYFSEPIVSWIDKNGINSKSKDRLKS